MNDRRWFTLFAIMAVIAVGAAGAAFVVKDAGDEPAIPAATHVGAAAGNPVR